jgi:hypothetical protein
VIINTTDVVHDAIDNEVVIVNLKNGRYYSLVGSGAAIWTCLAEGRAVSATVAHLLQRYSGEEPTMHQAVFRFVTELINEGLIVSSDAAPTPVAPTSQRPDSPRTPFQAPVISTHADMEGLLMLDPVHDVAAEGWPNQKP